MEGTEVNFSKINLAVMCRTYSNWEEISPLIKFLQKEQVINERNVQIQISRKR